MSSRAICPMTKDLCIEGCSRVCFRMVHPKPHIRFMLGEWSATVGIHGSIGSSPVESYQRLVSYLSAIKLTGR